MYEKDVIVTTKYGQMPSFVACPDAPGQYPGIIFYMDAPGIREELRNMTRRIAKQGYFAVLPDMYYRLGTLRFDVNRRDDEMFQCMRAAMNSLTTPRSWTTPRACSALSTHRTKQSPDRWVVSAIA